MSIHVVSSKRDKLQFNCNLFSLSQISITLRTHVSLFVYFRFYSLAIWSLKCRLIIVAFNHNHKLKKIITNFQAACNGVAWGNNIHLSFSVIRYSYGMLASSQRRIGFQGWSVFHIVNIKQQRACMAEESTYSRNNFKQIWTTFEIFDTNHRDTSKFNVFEKLHNIVKHCNSLRADDVEQSCKIIPIGFETTKP